MTLMTETDTPEMHDRVLRAARHTLGARKKFQANFEHGSWWVTELGTNAQWAVVDCATQDGVDYLGFEQVTQGDQD